MRGVVRRLFFCYPESPAMAGVMDVDGDSVRFRAKAAADVGDTVEMSGAWDTHPKFGRQFVAETCVVKFDESPEALAHLLATDKRFRGLGPARARKLVDVALTMASSDGSLGAALCEYATEIAGRTGIDLEIIKNAGEVWNSKKDYFDALAQLVEQGWSNAQANAILNKFGNTAPAIVRNNPYGLIRALPRFGFRTVDTIARRLGVPSDDPFRIMAGIAYCLDEIGRDGGHTWTVRSALCGRALEELKPDTLNGEELVAEMIQRLIDEGMIHVDFAPDGSEIVSNASMFEVESRVFDFLIAGLRDDALGCKPVDVWHNATGTVDALNDGQRAALFGFVDHRVSLITGGAGVGKTFTMQAVCETAEASGLKIALCAPTGKAARKLERATQRKALTIHRLLDPKFNDHTKSFSFTRNQSNPIEADLVVVDEFSMCDVRLAAALIDALPSRARLLLVGDHNQIPSVSPGAILRDILAGRDSFPGAVHVLSEVVRQAGVLARNTVAVLDGVVSPKNEETWKIQTVERGHEEGAPGIVAMLVEEMITSPTPVAPFDQPLDFAFDIQVLAPMRKGPMGTYAMNWHLQRLRQRLLGNPPPPPEQPNKPPQPLPGDRVIWTENDYELDLLNGTQAIVVQVHKGGALDLFVEDGREITIPAAKRNRVEVAWAMTIHKSQGSEFPMVILVVSSSHTRMADRNLLYTGISRAAQSVVIFGDWNGIRRFASQRTSTARQTHGRFYVSGWRPTNPVRGLVGLDDVAEVVS